MSFDALHIIDDPIADARWHELVERHPAASVFHSPAWLDALRRTYGYRPVALTTSRGPRIENGIVACRVRGWAARRLVSVPFSDHSDPLVAEGSDLLELVQGLVGLAEQRRWGHVELRPRSAGPSLDAAATAGGLRLGRTYCRHELDLRPNPSRIFAGFHHSSTQRAIRRAEREGVTYDAGQSDEQMGAFFRLLRMARRRHGLPPQPMAWFRNLRDSMGERLTLHIGRHQGSPIAALLTLSFRDTLVYKYGGSDASRHPLGAMPFLFWQAIQAAKAAGATTLDLGRSDLDQPGLIAFKEHLGAVPAPMAYYEHPARRQALPRRAWMERLAGRVFSQLPDSALDLAGRLIYRHLG